MESKQRTNAVISNFFTKSGLQKVKIEVYYNKAKFAVGRKTY